MQGGAPIVEVTPVELRFPPGKIFKLGYTDDERHNDLNKRIIEVKEAEIKVKQADIKARRLSLIIMQKVIKMKKSLEIVYTGGATEASHRARALDRLQSREGTTNYNYSFTISNKQIKREISIKGNQKYFKELSNKFPTIFFERYASLPMKERRTNRFELIGSWLAELILNYIVKVNIIRDRNNVFYLLFGVDVPTELDSSRELVIQQEHIDKLLEDIDKGVEELLRDINKDMDQLPQEMQQEMQQVMQQEMQQARA